MFFDKVHQRDFEAFGIGLAFKTQQEGVVGKSRARIELFCNQFPLFGMRQWKEMLVHNFLLWVRENSDNKDKQKPLIPAIEVEKYLEGRL